MSKAKKLTPKQNRFCKEYVTDHNGKQAAIRAKYSAKTAESQASRLLSNAKVQVEVARLEKKVAAKLEITAEKVLRDLETDKLLAREAGQHSASIRATELQGKHLKMFVDRVEARVTKGHEEALDDLDDEDK